MTTITRTWDANEVVDAVVKGTHLTGLLLHGGGGNLNEDELFK